MKRIGVKPVRDRDHFITREVADRVLDACPDAQWRPLFALSRYGGLRCPSELMALRWADVHWERCRMTIGAIKTEHHSGGGVRVIPIYSELRPHLEAVRDQAAPGDEYVITRYRGDSSLTLRTQLIRIIEKAGLGEWPKLWQNLRATRQTELAQRLPSYVVCEWTGNSQAVAQRHYLQVTDEHFDAAQKTAQQMHADCGEESHETEMPEEIRRSADSCDSVRKHKWALQDSNNHHFPREICRLARNLAHIPAQFRTIRVRIHPVWQWSSTRGRHSLKRPERRSFK